MPKTYFNETRFYAVQQVAEILGVKRNAIYTWLHRIDDPLPSHKLSENGTIRIHGSALNEWIDKRKYDPLNN